MNTACSPGLNLDALPPIFIIPTHLQTEELHEAEDSVYRFNGDLSYQATEARIFLGRISQAKRATFELRSRGVWTESSSAAPLPTAPPSQITRQINNDDQRLRKRSKLSVEDSPTKPRPVPALPDLTDLIESGTSIVVLKLGWLEDSIRQNVMLSHTPYLVYSGQISSKPLPESLRDALITSSIVTNHDQPSTVPSLASTATATSFKANHQLVTSSPTIINSILARAQADSPSSSPSASKTHPSQSQFHRRRFGTRDQASSTVTSTRPQLKRTTTSEFEDLDSRSLPPPPEWMSQPSSRPLYSCHRSTPLNPINSAFLAQLYKIKHARLLTLDEIGVRAYSTAIASLSAYPHKITSPLEITRLPGCSEKIATLWVEWHDSLPSPDILPSSAPNSRSISLVDPHPSDTDRHQRQHRNQNRNQNFHTHTDPDSLRSLSVVRDLEQDIDLQHLNLFYNIWGVGAETARRFYFENGWRDLDDMVEFGWHTLSRVQQIGVKYYDEFAVPIPRAEVEEIADVILHHARLAKNIPKRHWSNKSNGYRGNWTKPDDGRSDPGWDPRDFVCVIVGGYRRGKEECGDVDVVLSHRDARMTQDLVVDVVQSLERDGYVTHTLTLQTTSSERDQATLPFREGKRGHGFDSLDKALCVWQNPGKKNEVGSGKGESLKERHEDNTDQNCSQQGSQDWGKSHIGYECADENLSLDTGDDGTVSDKDRTSCMETSSQRERKKKDDHSENTIGDQNDSDDSSPETETETESEMENADISGLDQNTTNHGHNPTNEDVVNSTPENKHGHKHKKAIRAHNTHDHLTDQTINDSTTTIDEKKADSIHRRVDIIISPWRTVGAAVLGWSGATTFERDIRRWVRQDRGWKFDSSGVRDRGSGRVLDLEQSRRKPGRKVKRQPKLELEHKSKFPFTSIPESDTRWINQQKTTSSSSPGRNSSPTPRPNPNATPSSTTNTLYAGSRLSTNEESSVNDAARKLDSRVQSRKNTNTNTNTSMTREWNRVERAMIDDEDEDEDDDAWQDRERRLMDNLGIGWRPARERCTG